MSRVLAAAFLVLCVTSTARGERIQSFLAEVRLHGDDTFTVVEKIRYDFEGEQRRGIFRDIPIRYGRGRSPDYRIAVDVESVTDASGSPHPHRVSTSQGMLRIRIGDPDVLRSGIQDYWIRYRVQRGLLYLEGHDELYWNATGTAWPVPIDTARVLILLPEAALAVPPRLLCFTGPQGAVASDCIGSAAGDAVVFEAERPLGAREGLSVVVGFPKGVLREPSTLARLWSRSTDWFSGWFVLPALTLLGMLHLWRSSGRDPMVRGSIPVRYEPPAGLTPAEVGTVVDEQVDLTDISSTLLDLAVRGFLTIEEIESERFLFLTDRDYVLRKRREPQELRRHEALLMTRLFEDGDEVRVSELKNRFYRHLPRIREALYEEVSRDGRFFPTSPDKVRRLWAMGGLGVGGLSMAVLAVTGIPVLPAAACAASGAIVLGFSRVMPRRTLRGRRIYEEILGFREFVERVDADRLARMGLRSVERFEFVLPYAMVLGVADAWADAFSGIYESPPGWYVSPRTGGGFTPQGMVSDVGRSLGTIGQTLASQPRSAGSGSSGFGGGGFSGGGFGGGGGGSW